MKRQTDISEIRKVKDKMYGDPKVSLGGIAAVWQIYLAVRVGARWQRDLTADAVADMMILMKVMRRANPDCPSESLVDCGKDIAVYADIATETDGRIGDG